MDFLQAGENRIEFLSVLVGHSGTAGTVYAVGICHRGKQAGFQHDVRDVDHRSTVQCPVGGLLTIVRACRRGEPGGQQQISHLNGG